MDQGTVRDCERQLTGGKSLAAVGHVAGLADAG